jgi:hypothetical protein
MITLTQVARLPVRPSFVSVSDREVEFSGFSDFEQLYEPTPDLSNEVGGLGGFSPFRNRKYLMSQLTTTLLPESTGKTP